MPSRFRRASAALNAEADAVGALLDSGYLRLYNGTQPATANTQITSQALIAELRFASPAFQTASAGVATAYPLTDDPSARIADTPTWFRALASDDTPVYDGSVGIPGETVDLVIDHVPIQQNARVSLSSATYRAVTN